MLFRILTLLGLILLAAPVGRAQPVVVTTIAQIADPLQTIAGEAAEVRSLMGPGVDPHLYRPTRSDILALTRADMIVWTGQTLESKMAEAIENLASRLPVVTLIDGVPPAKLLRDPDNKHDPHLWMDVSLWAEVLKPAVAALQRLVPDRADAIAERADAYFERLARLDAQVAQAVQTLPDNRRVLITAHDAFAYFGARYGLRVEGVQGTSTESEAGLKDVERLVGLIVRQDIPAVFAETSVSERNVRALISGAAAKGHDIRLGGELFSDAMGAPGTPEGTYAGMIRHNARTIVSALGGRTEALPAGSH